MSDGYHHGDLPNALRGAAAELIAERGVAGFSLREVARRAGVSHAAPAHHYGDTAGLLTALAIEGFEHLEAELAAAVATTPDPVEQLVRAGRAYVDVATRYPAHCAVMFRHDLVTEGDERYGECGARAFAVLVAVMERIRAQHRPDLDVEASALHSWATMQGLVELYPLVGAGTGPLTEPLPDIAEVAERLGRITLAGLVGR